MFPIQHCGLYGLLSYLSVFIWTSICMIIYISRLMLMHLLSFLLSIIYLFDEYSCGRKKGSKVKENRQRWWIFRRPSPNFMPKYLIGFEFIFIRWMCISSKSYTKKHGLRFQFTDKNDLVWTRWILWFIKCRLLFSDYTHFASCALVSFHFSNILICSCYASMFGFYLMLSVYSEC